MLASKSDMVLLWVGGYVKGPPSKSPNLPRVKLGAEIAMLLQGVSTNGTQASFSTDAHSCMMIVVADLGRSDHVTFGGGSHVLLVGSSHSR